MSLFLSLAICFIPLIVGIALCLYFVKDFKILYSVQSLVMGLAAVILIILVRAFVHDVSKILPFTLSGYEGLLLSVVLFALLEESVKMLLITFFPKRINTFKNYMLVCLIFGYTVGSFETVMYLVTGVADTIPRLFTAVVVHALCALLSGYFVWAFTNKVRFARSFLMSFLLHGVYNFFAVQSSFLRWFAVVTILFAVIKCRLYYGALKENEVGLSEVS